MNIGEVLPQVGRRWRRPKHTFRVNHPPYVIQPFLLAPVLPGETLKQLLIQSRSVTDPVQSPLIGWWLEYYVFYVKHRDLDDRDLLVNMMLDPSTNTSSLNSAAHEGTYHYGNAPNWTLKCLQRVTDQYFRDEDEDFNSGGNYFGLPYAHAMSAQENFMDTLIVDAAMPEVDPNDTSGQALEPQMAAWDYARAMRMTDMTYEEWLRTYGVSVSAPGEAHKPELIRYLREWSYPSNTVDPLTGTPSSALSWSVAERADKDRFFKEPGWIFGVTVTRPKIYLSNLNGSAASLMADAMTWLPAIMRDEPWTSLKQVPTGAGPIQGITDVGGYWLDIKDLLMYGDQFCSYKKATSAAGANWVDLPSVSGGKRYASMTDIQGFFKSSTAIANRQDGVVSLAILGAQQDTT